MIPVPGQIQFKQLKTDIQNRNNPVALDKKNDITWPTKPE